MSDNYAAVDCGTNSTRVLIAGPDGSTLERLNTITRIGAGVAETGQLSPEGISRTVDALRDYRKLMDEYGVAADADHLRIAATSASRDASNRDLFFDQAYDVLGVRPELLTGDQEAAYSFAGATASLDPADGPFLVVDIGGGSTEFIVGSDSILGARSIDVGCVRLTETFFQHDPPLAEELSSCLSVIHIHLDELLRDIPAMGEARQFVGLAGTVTTVAAVEIGLADYSREALHHFELTREAGEDVFRTLATEALRDRLHNPGLEEGRADVIIGGCCILQAVFRKFGFDRCLVSEDDILDGLVASLR